MVDLWDRIFNRNKPEVQEAILKERQLRDKLRTIKAEGEINAKIAYEEALAKKRVELAGELAEKQVREEAENGGKKKGGFGEFAKNFTENMQRDTQNGTAFGNPLITGGREPVEAVRRPSQNQRQRSRQNEPVGGSIFKSPLFNPLEDNINNPFEMQNEMLGDMSGRRSIRRKI